MQPRFTVAILVLQAEGLVSIIRYSSFLFQTTPAGVVAEPQQITVLIGYLSWDADLVAVEVVGLLAVFAVFVDVALMGVIAYICATHSMSGLKVMYRLRLLTLGMEALYEIRITNF